VAAKNWEYDFLHGKIENPDKYTYAYYQKLAHRGMSGMTVEVDYDSDLVQQCLRLPEQTLADAQKILEQIFTYDGFSPAKKAEVIGAYVRSSTMYDLNAQQMPEGETDFAIWFLKDGDKGYCIHFATAAAVLLRAAGVPARYVTGFAVEVEKDIRKTVTTERAHAWVEYLDPELGWQILEATPGEALIEPDTTDPTEPPTDPTETEPPTDPTETEPTDPTETEPATQPPTKPTEPTDPTETEPTDPTSTTDPTQETQSGQTGLIGSGGSGKTLDWSRIMPVLKPILWVLGVLILLVCQRTLRIRHRKKRMYRGDVNRQALARWRYMHQLKRLTGQAIPQQLLELAEKAAFSQHTLTQAELSQFETWLQTAKQLLKAKPWPLRLAYKWIFAVL
jgi:transglutaminase-like putative cysteine protease